MPPATCLVFYKERNEHRGATRAEPRTAPAAERGLHATPAEPMLRAELRSAVGRAAVDTRT